MESFEILYKKDMENWEFLDFLCCFRYLEDMAKARLTNVGLNVLLNDIKDVCRMKGIDVLDQYDKELRLFKNHYINKRIDEEKTATRKKGANTPTNASWRALNGELSNTENMSIIKELRTDQARLALLLTRSSGARLTEILRLKISDLELVKGNDENRYLSLCIRRGKNCPKGIIPVYLTCYKNNIEKDMCPIRCLKAYTLKWKTVLKQEEGSFCFPSSPKHQGYHISGKAITDRWNRGSANLGLPEDQYVQAHSGHKQLVITACALKMTKEQILEATNWSSLKVLPMYVEGPSDDTLSKRIANLTTAELDEKLGHMLDF